MRELNHHALDLPDIDGMNRQDIEVWDDDEFGMVSKPPHVTLYFGVDISSVDLLPNEARALAALLINAADWQERRNKK